MGDRGSGWSCGVALGIRDYGWGEKRNECIKCSICDLRRDAEGFLFYFFKLEISSYAWNQKF